jgi:hypothetical protein
LLAAGPIRVVAQVEGDALRLELRQPRHERLRLRGDGRPDGPMRKALQIVTRTEEAAWNLRTVWWMVSAEGIEPSTY